MKSVITITLNPCVDISAQVKNVEPEEKLRCNNPQYYPGGGGITFGLANDYTLLESAFLGVAAGTATVLTEGTDLFHENDVWRLYREVKGQK